MKILKYIARLTFFLKGAIICTIKFFAFGLALSAEQTLAQEKQISYPVAVPVQRAAASSIAAPVYKAPEPVIRTIDEASTTPPVTRKKTVKKSSAETPAAKPEKKATAKTTTTKKPSTKSAAANKTATTKKATTGSANKKPVAKKSTVPVKRTTTASIKKNSAATSTPPEPEKPKSPAVVNTLATLEKPQAPLQAHPKTSLQTPAPPPLSNAVKMVIAPVAAANLAAPDLMEDEEAQLSASLEEDYSTDPEMLMDAKHAVATSSAPAAKNSSLPMGTAREGFVLEFKHYVETKIVPRVPGVAVAIIADGKVKVLQAYGVKKIGSADPINTDTAFRLASVSKTIAGTAAGVLVNDGLINWDTPVTSVLPNVQFSNPRYGNQITLRNIMSQSTGLPTHAGDNYIEEGLPFDSVIEKFKTINFVCPPGKCYSYLNVTMSLLSNIVQKKTGKSYEQYVKEKLFTPLGMRSASIGLEGLLATKNYAMPHEMTARGKWYSKEITQHYYRLNPAAGGNASINDMARWVLAHMGNNPDVLPQSTLQAVHAKVTKNTAAQSHYGARDGVTGTHYGMGWRTFDYRGDKNFLHHGGYVFGSRSEMVFNPELKIGMVILSNCNKLPGSVIFEFLDAYEDEKRGERRPAVQPVKAKAKKK